MGLLVEGKWVDQWYDTKSSGGKFLRTEAQFRNFIEKKRGEPKEGNK
jgi:putative glutathione S-transferase